MRIADYKGSVNISWSARGGGVNAGESRMALACRTITVLCAGVVILKLLIHSVEEGGFWARALGYSIFTQGEDWNDLRAMIKDAVACHFEKEAERPKMIRMMLEETVCELKL